MEPDALPVYLDGVTVDDRGCSGDVGKDGIRPLYPRKQTFLMVFPKVRR